MRAVSKFLAAVVCARRAVRWAPALALLVASAVHADDRRVVPEARIESARGVAMGTGVRAAGAATQAQAENPANLVLGGLYHIESFSGYSPTLKRFTYGGAVVDSMTSKLAAGISARGIQGDNSAGESSGWEGRVGLGLPIGEMLSIGVGGRFANFTISDQRAEPERPVVAGEKPDRTFKLHKVFTLDAALTLRLSEGISIAALGYNLIDTDSPLAPLMVGGSVAFGSESGLTLGGDVLVDLNTHKAFEGGPKLQFGGGLEYLAQGTIPVRVGYMYDTGRLQHAISGGFGYVDQRFGAQLSIRQTVSGGKETTLLAALQYFVQ
jgi:hypothetical protein